MIHGPYNIKLFLKPLLGLVLLSWLLCLQKFLYNESIIISERIAYSYLTSFETEPYTNYYKALSMSAFTFIVNGSINIPGLGSHFLLFIVLFSDIKALCNIKHVFPHRDISTSVTVSYIWEAIPAAHTELPNESFWSPYATNLWIVIMCYISPEILLFCSFCKTARSTLYTANSCEGFVMNKAARHNMSVGCSTSRR